MASTNEDMVVLATASLDDGKQVLVIRHLPDRGTVEIGWWVRKSGAVTPTSPVLELAAEAVEIDAVGRLCERLLVDANSLTAGEGGVFAETLPGVDGARIAAVRSGGGVTLIRCPEGGKLDLSPRAALGMLLRIFPSARRKLEELGFGLVQQRDATAAAIGPT